MSITVNPKTGLKEGHHEFYNAPLVYQRGIGSLKFNGQQTAVHTVPIGNGLTLDFYGRLGRSDELLVSFHGAIPPDRLVYPRFERVASLRPKGAAMMAFADPTFLTDPTRKMVSAWFLGGPGWDPIPLILRAVRRAQGKTGAKHIAFIGGSGGGFAALRASSHIEGSLAYIQDPQTRLAFHHRGNVDRYFSTVWPGWDQEKLLEAFPDRYDMTHHYQAAQPENYVYYAQSSGDDFHIENHYLPFLQVHGMTEDRGLNNIGNRYFALYDGEVPGHGKITADEFSHHFDAAMDFWRERRL